MWEGLFMLLVFGGAMALASFLAGSLPLSFSLTQQQMRLISAVGTGLLVGTALIIIIPEGIETLYSASSLPKVAFSTTPEIPLRITGAAPQALHTHDRVTEAQITDARDFVQFDGPISAVISRREEAFYPASIHPRVPSSHAHIESIASHAWIGLALVTGFILMYLIDALSHQSSHSSPKDQHIPLATMDDDTLVSPGIPKPPHFHAHSTTIGLVIHSFADGIALGASSANPSTQKTLGLVVFVAILVHKAPAAFGLTAVLLRQGVNKRAARGNLLLFSFAAPISAVITWTFVNLLGKSNAGVSNAAGGTWWTGIVLLFSGGTFLYVAMHAMQSVNAVQLSDYPADSGDSGECGLLTPYTSNVPPHGKAVEIMLMVTGMLLPLLTQIGHAHAHGSQGTRTSVSA